MKKHILNLILVAILVLSILPFMSFGVDADGATSITDGKYYDASLVTGFTPTSTFVQTKQTGTYTVKSGKVVSTEYIAMITYEPIMVNGQPINCSWIE